MAVRKRLRVFLAHSWATEQWNRFAKDDPHGNSDRQLGDMVADWMEEWANGRIQVVRSEDPFKDYVSARVRQVISSSDAVVCLFTKRTFDPIANKWIPSTYVVSEASAAQMQFFSETETHRRLFGLVEHDVDPTQLGMGFHGNKHTPQFYRDDLEGLKSQIRLIVDRICGTTGQLKILDEFEYLAIDKDVTIWRSGGVNVETRHRFRARIEAKCARFRHKIWRVSQELPALEELLSPSMGSGFLCVRPNRCGNGVANPRYCRIVNGKESMWGYEREFYVEFKNLDLKPGDQLEYKIAWGYGAAFHNHDENTYPNSVGLTTDGRGIVNTASLTLRFQRDLDGEPDRTIEGVPSVSITDKPDLPGAFAPVEFFHDDPSWKPCGEMSPCYDQDGNYFDVYTWDSGSFQGTAKAVWIPHPNYFDFDMVQSPTKSVDSIGSPSDSPGFLATGSGI